MAEENNPAPANAPEEKNQDWTDMIEVRDRGNAASVSGDGDSKILNQEEIDTLFGYSADKEGEDDGYTMKTGVQAILNSSMVSYERLPMLDIVFDRLIRRITSKSRSTTLNPCASANISIRSPCRPCSAFSKPKSGTTTG